jgi:hypothetical protein
VTRRRPLRKTETWQPPRIDSAASAELLRARAKKRGLAGTETVGADSFGGCRGGARVPTKSESREMPISIRGPRPQLKLQSPASQGRALLSPAANPSQMWVLMSYHWVAIPSWRSLREPQNLNAQLIGTVVIGRYTGLGLQGEALVTVFFLTLALAQLWHVFNMRGRASALSVMPSPAILMCGWPLPSVRRFFCSPSILRRLAPSCRLFLPIEPVGRRHHGIDSLRWGGRCSSHPSACTFAMPMDQSCQ